MGIIAFLSPSKKLKKMKCVAILLACIVAVSATVDYSCPDASSAKTVYVPEPKVDSSVYCVNLKTEQKWFTTAYYLQEGDISNFPKEDGEKANCADEPPKDLVENMRKALAKRLLEIVEEMNKQWEPEGFKKAIDEAEASDLPEYKLFASKLALKLNSAKLQFDCAVKRIQSRLACYHTQILSRFDQCLNMRKCRITSYENKMEDRKKQMVDNYKKSLARVTEAKHAFVKKTLEALFKCDKAEYDSQEIEKKIGQYKANLEACDKELWEKYEKDLADACKEMEDTYKCEYRCTFNSGCYSFSRSSYSRKCVQFPKPERVSYKLAGVSPFKATWKGGCIPAKKTCEKQTNEDFKKDDKLKHIDDEYTREYTEGLTKKFAQWKKEIEDWAKEAPKKLREILDKQVKKDPCTGEIIKDWQAQAVIDAQSWIDMHESRMLLEATQVHDNGKCAMDMWVSRMKAAVEKLAGRYNECINKKDTRKDCYMNQLESRRKCQRSQLENRLDCMIRRITTQFTKFLTCAGFDTFKAPKTVITFDYAKVMEAAKKVVMDKFDKWWKDYKAAVETRYDCGTKCTYKWNDPRMCFNFDYCMNAPCLSQYRSYC